MIKSGLYSLFFPEYDVHIAQYYEGMSDSVTNFWLIVLRLFVETFGENLAHSSIKVFCFTSLSVV